MSPDRVVYSFVLGWIVLIAVLIAVDWLGNPNRGGFRPKGDQRTGDRETRRNERARRRLEEDAAVRATLRDAYGASSLRLSWTSDQEDQVRQIDDSLIVVDSPSDFLETSSREVIGLDHTQVIGEPLPNIAETGTAEDPPTEAASRAPHRNNRGAPTRGWTVGDDPLAITSNGNPPAEATIRGRVWKNLGAVEGWSPENTKRLQSGKPPRRTNPITGKVERATVSLDRGEATWGSEPVDPFADPA